MNFIEAVKETAGAWNDEDHPELRKGASSWVENIREGDEKRLKEII